METTIKKDRERKLSAFKRRRVKHGEGKWIPPNSPSKEYLKLVKNIFKTKSHK